MFDTPAESAHEPEEEGRGLKVLHTLVADLAADVRDGATTSLPSVAHRTSTPAKTYPLRVLSVHVTIAVL